MRNRQQRFTNVFYAVLCLLLSITLCACSLGVENWESDVPAIATGEEETTKASQMPQQPSESTALHRVAYVPLDNRPVNKERMVYLAESAGIELLMPNEEFYRTALDNMQPNADGSTMGNREKLCEWLLEMDRDCDYFIISLDQMTSGGLVSSRWLSNTDLTFEYAIIDAILKLCRENTVYVFDTVMRLASTVDYQGYRLEEYNAFRAYGRVERKLLSNEELSIESIVGEYGYDQNGERIAIAVSEDARTAYHASRERKLKIIDYLLRSAKDEIDFLYIGVDDSSPQNTIQTNEIRYIQSLMGERTALSAATDELGLCCLARMISTFYGEVAVKLSYYGPGKDQPADGYDIGTLDESVRMHLSALSATQTEENSDALQVLFLTYGSTNAQREELMQKLKKNQREQVLTAVVDVSEQPQIFAEMLIGDNDVDLCQLLGYSSWNTAANAIGIALSQSVARYAYLHFVKNSTAQANAGFLKAMTFAYVKDISYKCFCQSIDGMMQNTSACSLDKVLERINGGLVITSQEPYIASPHRGVRVSNFRYPWNRQFEMTFDIQILEKTEK